MSHTYMKYKIGDMVWVQTEIRKNGKKYVLTRFPEDENKLEKAKFQIIGVDPMMESYRLVIDDEMIGWEISNFHIEYENVPKGFKGKKFWDITESYILE